MLHGWSFGSVGEMLSFCFARIPLVFGRADQEALGSSGSDGLSRLWLVRASRRQEPARWFDADTSVDASTSSRPLGAPSGVSSATRGENRRTGKRCSKSQSDASACGEDCRRLAALQKATRPVRHRSCFGTDCDQATTTNPRSRRPSGRAARDGGPSGRPSGASASAEVFGIGPADPRNFARSDGGAHEASVSSNAGRTMFGNSRKARVTVM